MSRINFLFVLILLLTACTPNPTPAPTPTVTSSPVVTETATIDTTPSGFDMAPTDSSDNDSELFIIPTTEDAKKHMSGETEIPESIKEVVTNYKAEMVKLIPEVAEVCVVPTADVKLVFKEGSVGDQYKWTVVYEAGQYTCWSTVESTGRLGEYPSYFDNTGRIKGHADRVSWERLEGKMYWAGTVPVLITNKSYIVPDGLNGSQVSTPDNWSILKVGNSTGEGLSLLDNPISPEKMSLLTSAGYRWDAITETLKNIDGKIALTLQNGKWVDRRTGTETLLDALKLVEVNGVDFQGRNIECILTREVNGETQIYLPMKDAWVTPMDVLGSQKVIDRNKLHDNTYPIDYAHWGDYRNFTYDELPTMTWDDVENLFYSELLVLKSLPANVNVQPLNYLRLGLRYENKWTVSEYPDNSHQDALFMDDNIPPLIDRPILWENDAVRVVSAFRIDSDVEGEDAVVAGQRYSYNGRDVILHGRFLGNFENPAGSDDFDRVMRCLSNPAWLICEPDAASLNARAILPRELQELIAQFDGIENQVGVEITEKYPVGNEIFVLQGEVMEMDSMHQHALQIYLRPEDDPAFDGLFPGK